MSLVQIWNVISMRHSHASRYGVYSLHVCVGEKLSWRVCDANHDVQHGTRIEHMYSGDATGDSPQQEPSPKVQATGGHAHISASIERFNLPTKLEGHTTSTGEFRSISGLIR
jgi:hypothetical protein